MAPLVVNVSDLEAWSRVGLSNGSIGLPLFPYECTPFFISSNGTFFLSSESLSFLQSINGRCPFLFLLPAHRWPLRWWCMAADSLSSNLWSWQIYRMFLIYIHIVSYFLGYIFIAWNAMSLVVVEYTLCLLKCNHYVWQYFYNFQDNYRSSIVGNIIHCGHTCVHHRVHCVVWFFTHHTPI
jgi:hypothetical protein